MTAGVRVAVTPALWLSCAGVLLGWLMILSGIGLFGWDCLTWLRTGAWDRQSLADLWGHAPLGGDRANAAWEEMRGLHYLVFRILHWCGRFPLSVALVAVGGAAAWISNDVHDRAEADPARHMARMRSR
jgi:hypothetical protein